MLRPFVFSNCKHCIKQLRFLVGSETNSSTSSVATTPDKSLDNAEFSRAVMYQLNNANKTWRACKDLGRQSHKARGGNKAQHLNEKLNKNPFHCFELENGVGREFNQPNGINKIAAHNSYIIYFTYEHWNNNSNNNHKQGLLN